MIQSQLAKRISAKNPSLKRVMMNCIKAIENKIIDHLSKGGRVEIRGFGSFEPRYRRERIARNPKTGEFFTTVAKNGLRFRPGRLLRERVFDTVSDLSGGPAASDE